MFDREFRKSDALPGPDLFVDAAVALVEDHCVRRYLRTREYPWRLMRWPGASMAYYLDIVECCVRFRPHIEDG